ncbi:MAG: hypothetical protein ABI297_07340 [Ginsengibacter sp.]
MKLQSNTLLESLTDQELNLLTIEVKETLSKDFKKKKRNFTTTDLWNIQRRAKSYYARRSIFLP